MVLEIFSFGLFGDYNKIRKLTLRCRLFYPWFKLYEAFHCAFLPLNAKIEGDIIFPHGPKSCFFSTGCHIGKNCIILQNVNIVSNYFGGRSSSSEMDDNAKTSKKFGAPYLEDNVIVGTGAIIVGPVRIDAGATIGTGCVVAEDVPAGAVCVMQKPRIIIR